MASVSLILARIISMADNEEDVVVDSDAISIADNDEAPHSPGKQQTDYMSYVMRRPKIWVSEHVRHKPNCTSTEDGWKLVILDFRNFSYCEADLQFCFRICKM